MMNAWIQKSDFSTVDIDPLNTYASFEECFDSLDKAKLDAMVFDLVARNEDFCPWGLGVDVDTFNYSLHVCREDVAEDTYFIMVDIIKKHKILGLIPISKNHGYVKEGLSMSEMKREASRYYEQIDKLPNKEYHPYI